MDLKFEAADIHRAAAVGGPIRDEHHAFAGGAEVAIRGGVPTPRFSSGDPALVVAVQESAETLDFAIDEGQLLSRNPAARKNFPPPRQGRTPISRRPR
jgi:hypothetical protein